MQFIGISSISFLIFLIFQAKGVWGADSGDMVTAAFVHGVPHPPGFPLYTFLAWMLTKIPFSTIAWRVTLLSSIPHALTLGFVYLIVRQLAGKKFISLFAPLILLSNYVFFEYSVVAEVFALNDLFISAIIYYLILWFDSGKQVNFYIALFLLFLSFSHHPIILFILPALLFLGFSGKKYLPNKRQILRFLPILFLAFIPFLYIPIASHTHPIINWDNADTISGFFRLITRAGYGTFQSATVYGTSISQRLLQLKMYWGMLFFDFSFIGIFLSAAGLFYLFKIKRIYFWFFSILLIFTGPIYFFYASYVLLNRFDLGIFERFLLQSYLIIHIIYGIGISSLIMRLKNIKIRLIHKYSQIISIFLILFLTVYTGLEWYTTFIRFRGLPNDRTMEYLAMDYLDSVPSGSILLMTGDIQLFTTQYLRYAAKYRKDVILLMSSRITDPAMYSDIAKNYPQLQIPDLKSENIWFDFIKMNSRKIKIFSNETLLIPNSMDWVIHGLVYQLYDHSDLPSYEKLVSDNDGLWEKYHLQNIQKGLLVQYRHLMLAAINNDYVGMRNIYAKKLLDAGFAQEAKDRLLLTVNIDSDMQKSVAYKFLGLSELILKNCQAALNDFQKARETTIVLTDDKLLLYESATYKTCIGDEQKANALKKEYDEIQKKQDTPLEPK
jgi:hypothetical protein